MANGRPATGVPAHLRAALALRGYTAQEFAGELPPELRVSPRTLARILQGERPAEDWELRSFARILDVPERFLREGVGPAGDLPPEELTDLLARNHEEVLRRLDALDEQLRILSASTPSERSRP